MTLVIGVKCSDGVVMVADSAATFGYIGQHTIWQPTSEKVEVVDSRGLIAVSGPVGLGQRFKAELARLLQRNDFLKRPAADVMTEVSQAFRGHLQQEFNAANMSSAIFGQSLALQSVSSATLVALAPEGGPTLFEFDHQGSPEELSISLPFSCIGSGKALADAYMAFFRKLFWPEHELPNRGQAEFAAVWAMRQSIAVAPGGLGPPEHLYRLFGDGKRYVASEVEQGELEEHRTSIRDITTMIEEWYHAKFDEEVELPPK